MTKKNKVTIKLEPGESYVIANLEFWRHIISTYSILAATESTTPEEEAMWYDAAHSLEKDVEENLYTGENEENEDE